MKASLNQNTPTSFAFFNQIDDPSFLQYLETYCSVLDKKEKETLEKSKRWFLFEEDENEGNLNAFQQNLSRPSFNCFDLKGTVHSHQQIQKDFSIKEEDIQTLQNQIECKIEAQNTNKNLEMDLKKEVSWQLKNGKWERRLNEITGNITLVKAEILELMEYFDEQITKKYGM